MTPLLSEIASYFFYSTIASKSF